MGISLEIPVFSGFCNPELHLETGFRLATYRDMGQLKLSDSSKDGIKSSELTTVTSTTPSVVPEVGGVRVRTLQQKSSSRCRGLSIFLFLLLTVSFMATLKKLCDYKELNIRLMQELALERSKDSILKEAVRASVPEEKFALISSNPNLDIQMPEEEQPRGLFEVNLMVLWSSPPIYNACNDDLVRITNQLVFEIYRKKEINKAEEDENYRKKDYMYEERVEDEYHALERVEDEYYNEN